MVKLTKRERREQDAVLLDSGEPRSDASESELGKSADANTAPDSVESKPLDGPEPIFVGEVYRRKDSQVEVTPFGIERGAVNRVHFNQLGRGREEIMSEGDFLAAFEHVGAVSPTLADKQDA